MDCPLDRPTLLWTTVFKNEGKEIWLCKNSTKFNFDKNVIPSYSNFDSSKYDCKGDRLCIYNYHESYPVDFKCSNGKSISAVNVTVYGKCFHNCFIYDMSLI